ncbi:MAG: hypothetical protein PSN34_06770 [Urechidicola sp.]|nr:hypothetical protein [Urechidicola sp.]
MNEIFNVIILTGFTLSFFSYGIAYYMNLWIYYTADENKFPFFPILNPFSISTYELMFKSMLKLNWKTNGENEKLKLKSNNMRKFSGIMLLLALGFGILSLIFY